MGAGFAAPEKIRVARSQCFAPLTVNQNLPAGAFTNLTYTAAFVDSDKYQLATLDGFRAPRGGLYRVTAGLIIDAAAVDGTIQLWILVASNFITGNAAPIKAAFAIPCCASVSSVVQANAGDTINVEAFHENAGGLVVNSGSIGIAQEADFPHILT